MTKYHSILMKNKDYSDAFHIYFQYVGRNKRYANIYLGKMEKIEKAYKASLLNVE
jgi:hypothetical protein